MATILGTKLGTMLGTELADFADPGPPAATIASLLPRIRFRASQAATSAGNVVSVPNEGSAGGQLNVAAGTLAAPVADAIFNGQPSLVFSGTQEISASFAAALATFMHNGTPATMYAVSAGTSGALHITNFTTATSVPGFRFTLNASLSSGALLIGAGTASIPVSSNVVGYSPGTAAIARAILNSAGSPQWSHARNGVVIGSGSFATANATAAPTYPLTIGRIPNGGTFQSGRFAEFIAYDRVLTVPELAVVDAELFATYGVHA